VGASTGMGKRLAHNKPRGSRGKAIQISHTVIRVAGARVPISSVLI
jgi:hypothetical protein